MNALPLSPVTRIRDALQQRNARPAHQSVHNDILGSELRCCGGSRRVERTLAMNEENS